MHLVDFYYKNFNTLRGANSRILFSVANYLVSGTNNTDVVLEVLEVFATECVTVCYRMCQCLAELKIRRSIMMITENGEYRNANWKHW
jgi:hypothetical protein